MSNSISTFIPHILADIRSDKFLFSEEPSWFGWRAFCGVPRSRLGSLGQQIHILPYEFRWEVDAHQLLLRFHGDPRGELYWKHVAPEAAETLTRLIERKLWLGGKAETQTPLASDPDNYDRAYWI